MEQINMECKHPSVIKLYFKNIANIQTTGYKCFPCGEMVDITCEYGVHRLHKLKDECKYCGIEKE